jgi:hypothetical protein
MVTFLRRDLGGADGDRRTIDLRTLPGPPTAAWRMDPMKIALAESARRQGTSRPELPRPFCLEIGRRLLLAELQFSDWVLRRVEKVEFERDRSITRRISIEFRIRDDAPVFVDDEGGEFWLVPLSMMRRRTMVNFSLSDEAGRAIPMPGIRWQQQLDQSILLAAAAASHPELVEKDAGLLEFVRCVIAGELPTIVARMAEWDGQDAQGHAVTRPDYLEALRDDPLFAAVLTRLRRSFSLYAVLPVKDGRHRLLWMSFDEPTDWRAQVPSLRREPGGNAWRYRSGGPAPLLRRLGGVNAALGISATRVRFQIPAAENAASYHFELTTPPGLRIVQASLLAGRPNDPGRHVSMDHVVGHSPTVGLHAVEIPNGSLCRAQVDIRVPIHGWLTTLVTSCWLIFLVLLSVLYHWRSHPPQWSSDQVTNIAVLLVTTSAGVATLIAQRGVQGAAARLLTWLRAIGVLAMALPVVAAGVLIYTGEAPAAQLSPQRRAMFGLTAVSLVLVLLVSAAWLRAWRDERRSARNSPWDMTDDRIRPQPKDFLDAVHVYGFDTPAIGIRSVEGWHETYAWDDDRQEAAAEALDTLGARTDPTRGASATMAGRDGCSATTRACAEHEGCAARHRS